MKKHEPGTCKRITTGRHLNIKRIQRRERVFPDTNYDAPPVAPRLFDVPCFMEVPFLLIAVPVSAVILHDERPTARYREHHIEPNRPKCERALVTMARTNHAIEQCKDLALNLGSRLIAG
jgi:hypothetical protein